MASKFYVDSATHPSITIPAPEAGWEHATAASAQNGSDGYSTCQMNTTKQSSSMVTIGGATTYDAVDHTGVGADQDALLLRLVSRRLKAMSMSGSETVTGQFITREGTNSDNLVFSVKIYTINAAGTLVTTPLALTRNGTEFSNALTNHTFSFTTAAGPFSISDGDRLVIEIGCGGQPASGTGTNGHNQRLVIGDNSASDLPVNETATTQDNPWINFATNTFVFLSDIVGDAAGSSTPAGVLKGAGELAGGSAGSSTPAATIGGAAAASGATTGSSTPAASIGGIGAMVGSASGSSTLAADAKGAGALIGDAAGASTPSADAAGSAAAATGAATGSSAPSADIGGEGQLAGSSTGQSLVEGDLQGTQSGDMVGSASGSSALGGDLTGAGAMAASATGQSTPQAGIQGAGVLAGDALGASAPAVGAQGAGALQGAASGQSTPSAQPGASGAATGGASGASTAAGDATGAGALQGASSGQSTVTGDLSGIGSDAMEGTAAGASSPAGSLTGLGNMVGAASGSSALGGAATGSGSLAGGSAGSSTAAAMGQLIVDAVGAAFGASDPAASAGGVGSIQGDADGQSIVDAIIAGGGVLVGTADGSSFALLDIGSQGQGLFQSNGNIIRSRFHARVATPLALPTHYDNAPFDKPEAARWCRLEVDIGGLEHRSTGDDNMFRKRGEFRAIVHVPVEDGSGVATQIADTISSEFRMVVDQGVHFGVPRVVSRSRFGAWWQLIVACPFHDDIRVPMLIGVPGTITGVDDIYAVVRTRFRDLVATPESLPVAHENAPFTTPDTTPWAMLTILPGDSDIAELGSIKTYRTPGVVMVRIYVPLESGDAEARRLADVVVTNFRAVRDRGVLFRTPSAGAGRAEGPWWTVNVEVPFLADLRAV